MAGRRKRAGSSGTKQGTKRARFKPIERRLGQNSTGITAATASGSQTSDTLSTGSAQPRGHVHIDNINVYASVDGRRLGKQTGSRLVAVNPAEWIFASAKESTSTAEADREAHDADAIDTVLDCLPVNDAEALQDKDPDIQLAPKKKRVRHDLRAAV